MEAGSSPPANVTSAIQALRDLITAKRISSAEAVSTAARDWEIKPEVLRVRFTKAYGLTPEEMEANLPPPPGGTVVPHSGSSTKGVPSSPPPRRHEDTAPEGTVRVRTACTKPKPAPSAFGLPPDFVLEHFEAKQSRLEQKTTVYAVIATATSIAFSAFTEHPFIYSGLFILFGFGIFSGVISFILTMEGKEFYDVSKHYRAATQYRRALEDWIQKETEIGLEYWRAMRGVPFERAVANLFERRGCRAMLTKGSGDGGIDIHLEVAGNAFGCQCKAHAKPVGVKTIREIVGSCQRLGKTPVVFAVNGFTKPALDEASELGVVCLDAPDLCKIAEFDSLSVFPIRT